MSGHPDFQVVGQCGDGATAIAAIVELAPDLVLLDVQMPEMGGFEATEAIRARERANGGHVPIVAMTAHAMAGDRERALEAGCNDYDTKPIELDRLLAKMQALLPAAP